MKALVVFDGRFYNNEGTPCSYHLTYDLFTKRYLSEFSEVTVVGRIFNKTDIGANSVVGENASFVGIPGYVGPKEFISKLPKILKVLWSLDTKDTAVFLRTPGTIPFILSLILVLKGKCFAVEVVADPFDQLSEGAVIHPIRGFFQKLYTRTLKWQCQKAIGASYVTKHSLQKKYPPKSQLNTHYTSLNLGDEWFVAQPKDYPDNIKKLNLINVGMMTQLYKAQDIILEAVKILKERNIFCSVIFIGDGEYKSSLESMASNLGVSKHVKFLGKISDRDHIKSLLDQSDIFILPSRQEGLPRAMIEAMSRALPCIGTNVGGISELIDDEFIINVNDPRALAEKIIFCATNHQVMSEQSLRNLKRAMDYKGLAVQARREEFYRGIKELSL